MVLDINSWLLQRNVRRAETQARTDVQLAATLVQQALTTRAQLDVQRALDAVSKAVADAQAVTSAAQRLVVHEQRRAQGKMPLMIASSASQAVSTTQTLTDQASRAAQAVAADPSGGAAWAQVERAYEVMNGVESALEQAKLMVHDTLDARTAYDQARKKNRTLARQRQKYLAQFGGIDPVDMMERVKAGQYPTLPAGIMLRKDEVALGVVPSSLAEDRTTRQHVGGYAGYSIPVGYGVRFRVGSYRGRTITHEQLTTVDQGTVVVTNQRVVFNGSRRTLSIPIGKVLNTVLYRDGVDVRTENRTKREVFQCVNARLLNTLILVACQLV